MEGKAMVNKQEIRNAFSIYNVLCIIYYLYN